MTFEQRYSHAIKYNFQTFNFEGNWYDTFNKPIATIIPKKYFDALYEVIGDFTENPYYDIEDKIINLKQKICYSNDSEYSWGDFLIAHIFMRFVNYKRGITKPDYMRRHYFEYSDLLKDLVDEYINEMEVR